MEKKYNRDRRKHISHPAFSSLHSESLLKEASNNFFKTAYYIWHKNRAQPDFNVRALIIALGNNKLHRDNKMSINRLPKGWTELNSPQRELNSHRICKQVRPGVVILLSVKWKCEDKISITLKRGGHLNIKMSSYQYRDPHVKDKTVSRPSYL